MKLSPRAVRALLGTGAVAVAVLLAFAVPALVYTLRHVSTDDATVDGTIVPVSAEVSGTVAAVYVRDNQPVHAGDSLALIDPDDYQAALDQADASLGMAEARATAAQAAVDEGRRAVVSAVADSNAAAASADQAARERDRLGQIVRSGSVSQNAYDQADAAASVAAAKLRASGADAASARARLAALEAQARVAAAAVAQARADQALARLHLGRTMVRAPLDGVIAKKDVDPGKYVTVGRTLLAVVDEAHLWVTANFKETQLAGIRVGAPVDIDVDAYPGVRLHGHVDSVQPGSGAVFSLIPPENATGNYVKIVQRVPVKILIDSPPDAAHPLWPGLSVEPHVSTGH